MGQLPFLLLLLFYITVTSSTAAFLTQFCGTTNYTQNSAFNSNLKALLASLSSSNALSEGFVKNSYGDSPDRVNGVILCRGDVTPEYCRRCSDIAVQEIVQKCPYKKTAIVWYDDCMLRVSDLLTFSASGGSNKILRNTLNLTEVNQFQMQLSRMMSALTKYAAYNTTAMRFATGIAEYGDSVFPHIYGLVQCTRDISAGDCESCLGGSISYLQRELTWSQGIRYLTPTCNLRYEVYPFYKGSALVSIPLSANATPPSAAAPPFPLEEKKKTNKRNSTGTILAVILPLVAALALVSISCVCWSRRHAGNKARSKARTSSQQNFTLESLLFPLSTLRAATDDFSELNKLGEGGFGSVYKGVLPDGTAIAAKRLSPESGQGIEQLKNEVVLLAQLQHRNLVRLLGVCLEDKEMLLVYEYVANRSLDTVLFDDSKSRDLNWARRFKIIEGIARGLQYLHEESQVKIVHRDLKANNVLLDAHMNPKISDFGLARLVNVDQTQASTTRVVGTYGYMSPEYAMWGNFSNKSDVFSFGVLVLEIITGQRNSCFSDYDRSADLMSCTWEKWKKGTVLDIVDPALNGSYQKSEVMRCIQLALLCLQEAPESRPSMSSVILRLSSFSISIQAPPRPGFLMRRSGSSFMEVKEEVANSTNTPFLQSSAEMSMSGVEPR